MAAFDTTSYWIDSSRAPRRRKLDRNVKVDVIVIGGGITGITAAYLLKKAGRTVALVERGRCARVDTGNTTAHLTSVTDLRLYEIAARFGRDAARATWDAGAAAIDQIVNLVRAEDIACDFRWVPGFLHAAPGPSGMGKRRWELQREAAAAQEIGVTAEYLEQVPFFGVPGVRFSHQAIFHPLKYLAALLRNIPGRGSHVFEHTEAGEIQAHPLKVQAGKFSITGCDLILATHTPLMGNTSLVRATLFQTKLSLYTSYAVSAKIAADRIPEGAYWDTAKPYHYLRVERRRDHDYAIFGGEDHKTGQADPRAAYARLEKTFGDLFPEAAVDHRWSGQVVETNDGLPFIGETAAHQFAATGFSGNGMTFGTLGAMMAADAVLKQKNPWSELFDVHRAKIRGGTWQYLKENKDYPYYMLRDWLGGAEGKSLGSLKRNDGKILSLRGKKVAAHRDAKGHITLCSPVCTHLQCIVAWNPAEQTWDCPCHGSRFKPTGEVIAGPAEEALKRISPPNA